MNAVMVTSDVFTTLYKVVLSTYLNFLTAGKKSRTNTFHSIGLKMVPYGTLMLVAFRLDVKL